MKGIESVWVVRGYRGKGYVGGYSFYICLYSVCVCMHNPEFTCDTIVTCY